MQCSEIQMHKDGNPRCSESATQTLISYPGNGSKPVHTFLCAKCAQKKMETLARFVRCELRDGIVAREISEAEKTENRNAREANRMTQEWIEGEAR